MSILDPIFFGIELIKEVVGNNKPNVSDYDFGYVPDLRQEHWPITIIAEHVSDPCSCYHQDSSMDIPCIE